MGENATARRIPVHSGAVDEAVAERQHPAGDTAAEVRRRIAAQYAPYAHAIADALGESPLCVVTGPRRFGKTTSLLPLVATLTRDRGKSAAILDGRAYEREAFTAETLPEGRVDVLLVDEANVLTRTRSQTRDCLRLLHRKGTAVVAVITFAMGFEAGAVQLAKVWGDAESSLSGHEAPLMRLPQMRLAPQLARALLMLYSPIETQTARTQVVDFIVERVPLTPYVLREVAAARSIVEIRSIVHQRRLTLFQGALSAEEYRELERSLQE